MVHKLVNNSQCTKKKRKKKSGHGNWAFIGSAPMRLFF